jgi:hypothetical protein
MTDFASRTSEPELTQMMIGVLVRKQSMRGLDRAWICRRDLLEPLDRASEIGSEVGRPRAFGPWVMSRIRRHATRPANRSPQHQCLHEGPAAMPYGTRAWPRAHHHRGGVSEVTEHLMRRQRAPASFAILAELSKSKDQGTQDGWVSDSLQGPVRRSP